MAALAVGEQDFQKASRLTAAFRGDSTMVPTYAVLDTMAHADSVIAAGAVDRFLGTAAPPQLEEAVYPVQLTEDVPDAIRIASRYADSAGAARTRGFGYGVLMDLALEGGRWDAAWDYGQQAVRFAPDYESEVVAAALLPFIPVPREDLVAVRRSVARWDSVAAPGATQPAARLRPHVRLYLMGALDSRLGDGDAALRAAQALDSLPGAGDYEPTVHALAAQLRAQVAARAGQTEKALALLRTDPDSLPPPMGPSSILNLELGRFWKAELLYQLGRDREALDWYRNAMKLTNHEPAFIPMIHLRCAQIYERLGQQQQATEEYSRFVHLWKNADPGLQSLVAYAQERLGHLSGRSE